MSQLTEPFSFEGGVDLETPFFKLTAGRLRDGINYECLPNGGYRRIKGYQLYDGRGGGMQQPAGSGPVTGVWIYNGVGYAVRNNGGGTAGVIYQATAGGWSAIPMPTLLRFNTGSYFFQEGDIINGQTSGAQATVARVGNNSGSISGPTLAGILALTNITGTFQNGENIRIGVSVKAVAGGAQFVYALPPGGDYHFWNYNFLGNAAGQRMYMASGVGEALEWDGSLLFPISQQVGTEWPLLVVGHSDHLFLGFAVSGILRSSSIGKPRDYLSTTDAVDIGVSDAIKDLRPLVGGVLAIGGNLSTKLLYGTDATTWLLKRFSDNGVRERSMKEIGGTAVIVDSRGVQRMDQTLAFGDFQSKSISVPINRNLLPVLQIGTPSCAVVSRNKDQYRLFFGKGGYYFTFNAGAMVGVTRIAYAHEVTRVAEGLDALNNELLLFADNAGNVFRMDTTNYFNGTNITASFNLAFGTQGAPTRRKQYRKVTVYLQVDGSTPTLQAQADFDLIDGTIPSSPLIPISATANSGTLWDVGQWDTFQWAGGVGGTATFTIDGTGQNMAMSFYSGGSEDGQHTYMTGVLHYSPRRLMR